MYAKSIIRATLLAFALTACGKDAGAPAAGGTPATFVADRASYQPMEWATITVSAPGTEQQAAGTIGGQSVRLARSSDSTFVLVIPAATTAGSQTLRFSTGGRSYSGTLAIEAAAPPVADAQAFLADVDARTSETIAAARTTFAEDTSFTGRADAIAALDAAEDSLARYRQVLATLTPTERQQLADFLSVNLGGRIDLGVARTSVRRAAYVTPTAQLRTSLESTSMETLGLMTHTTCTGTFGQRYACRWGDFADHLANTVLYYASGYTVASLLIPLSGPVGIGVAGVIGAFAILEGAQAAHTAAWLIKATGMVTWSVAQAVYEVGSEHLRATFAPSGQQLVMAGAPASALSMTELMSERAVGFTFEARMRTIAASDAASSLPWASAAMRGVAEFNEFFGRISERLTIQLAPPTTAWMRPDVASQVSVEVVGSSSVRLAALTGGPDRYDVTFTTTATTPQQFTYDVIYASGVFPAVRLRHQATLNPPAYALAKNGALVSDTLRYVDGESQWFTLRYPDGAPVAGIDYTQAGVANPTNGAIAVTATAGPTVFGITARASSAAVGAFDVTYRGRKVQTVPISVGDSIATYKAMIPGRWRTTWYFPDGAFSQEDIYDLTADGGGRGVSTRDRQTTYANNASYTWTITRVLMPDGTTRYELRVGLHGGLLTVPLSEMRTQLADKYSITSKM